MPIYCILATCIVSLCLVVLQYKLSDLLAVTGSIEGSLTETSINNTVPKFHLILPSFTVAVPPQSGST